MGAADTHPLDKARDCSDRGDAAHSARERLSLCATQPPESRTAAVARPKEGETRLPEQVERREQELTAKYPGIMFVPPGQKIGEQQREGPDGKSVSTGVALIARAPTMKELAALDSALQHSEPSYRSLDGRPLRIAFSNQNPESGPNAPGAAFDPPDADHPQGPELNIFPSGARMPALQKDIRHGRTDITQAQSLEGILNHELGHAAQYRTGGLEAEADAQYKHDAGWVPLKQPPGKDPSDWALRGKDGYLYQPISEAADRERWVRLEGGNAVDSQGRPVGAGYDADGNYKGHYLDSRGRPLKTPAQAESDPKGPGNVASIDAWNMAQKAVVKPIGPYFPNPEEEVAEGMRAYRTDLDSRTQLLQRSPGLYRAAQNLDQLDLDKTYGQGTKVRLPDGTIADATPSSQSLVRRFEERGSH